MGPAKTGELPDDPGVALVADHAMEKPLNDALALLLLHSATSVGAQL